MTKERKAILTFYIITFVISLGIEAVMIADPSKASLMYLLMWVPGVVGIILSKVFFGRKGSVGVLRKFKPVYILWGIVIPVIYLALSYPVAWAVFKDPTIGIQGLAEYNAGKAVEPSKAVILLVVLFFFGMIGSALTATGEELGWRGFVYPLMEKEFGPVKAVAINGFLWALWHVPLIIGGVYQAAVNPVYGVIMFIIDVMIITIIFTWSRSVSGSVIPAVLLHSSHNLVDQMYLQPLSTDPRIPYLAGEQGIITILFSAVIAVIVIRHWKEHRKKAALEKSET